MKLTVERLKECLRYDPDTGQFTWLKMLSNKGPVGSVAGYSTLRKCICIGIDKEEIKAHRLAFFYMNGEWPKDTVDHINGDPTDNRWSNLRVVKHQVNTQNARKARTNSQTGVLGVSPSHGLFVAQITVSGKQINLGRYPTIAEASTVYLKAKRQLHEGCTI